MGDQMMRESVGAGIELGVGKFTQAIDQGDGLRGAGDLLFEHGGQAAGVVEGRVLAGENVQPLLAFERARQRQSIHADVVIRDDAAQQRDELGQMALDGVA
ncbi:hypothetical protein, partial [Xanthomonas translucens]